MFFLCSEVNEGDRTREEITYSYCKYRNYKDRQWLHAATCIVTWLSLFIKSTYSSNICIFLVRWLQRKLCNIVTDIHNASFENDTDVLFKLMLSCSKPYLILLASWIITGTVDYKGILPGITFCSFLLIAFPRNNILQFSVCFYCIFFSC